MFVCLLLKSSKGPCSSLLMLFVICFAQVEAEVLAVVAIFIQVGSSSSRRPRAGMAARNSQKCRYAHVHWQRKSEDVEPPQRHRARQGEWWGSSRGITCLCLPTRLPAAHQAAHVQHRLGWTAQSQERTADGAGDESATFSRLHEVCRACTAPPTLSAASSFRRRRPSLRGLRGGHCGRPGSESI